MDTTSDAAKAERLSRRRARALPVLAIIFISQQINYFTGSGSGSGGRTVDHIHISAWIVLAIVMLLALTTGGGWIYSRSVRALANDESTRAHRDDSFRIAFLAAMTSCILLYVVSLFEVLDGRDAVHLVMTVGIATALLRFAWLERRAHRE